MPSTNLVLLRMPSAPAVASNIYKHDSAGMEERRHAVQMEAEALKFQVPCDWVPHGDI